ncbi:hypothetical protein B0H15DRAFT_926705 [Mycena belliarum]|uniref:Uncharacterized protein n=1 Tax=Mycena belliarum TaxID=1033014 RepID=A0AAD6UIB7_9AGAR|nr:hypothetical protein B0H15DRAFT_926705 [Mycena belliae]
MTPPPSPSPALPGAWPSSVHRRSTTCPTTSPRPVVEPLHLERVLDFQQRLVNQIESDMPSPTSFSASASADSAMAPADSLDSELTRFRTDTSTSIMTDTSVSTTYTSRSSPERFATAKLPQLPYKTKYSAVENNFLSRIPRSTSCAGHQNVFSTESPPQHRHSKDSPSSPTFTRALDASPISPIVFASPASSSFPRCMSDSKPSPRDRSSSYEYNSSPSWETSYGSEYNDRYMLNASPSPSPLSSRPAVAARISGTANGTPSIEIGATVPMLTSLSLPASPDTSMSLDLHPIVSASPRISPIDGNASPWTLSLSPASPVLSVVPDLSLSSPVTNGHVLSFPSPTFSVSPFESPLPSPVLDGTLMSEYAPHSSAAEYAAALMSSSWAPDALSLAQTIPHGLLLAENDTSANISDPGPSNNMTLEESGLPEPLFYLQNVQHPPTRRQEGKMGSVLSKMKKLGDKVKRLLRGKPKGPGNEGVNVDINVRRVGSVAHSPLADALPDVIDIQSHTAAAQVYDSLLPNHGTESHLPLPLPPPPGLDDIYGSTSSRLGATENTAGHHTPTIRIRPPSCSGPVQALSNDSALKTPSPDLTAHSRPKTLAEIKSKRRLSLSTLSSFARSPSPTPPVNRGGTSPLRNAGGRIVSRCTNRCCFWNFALDFDTSIDGASQR